MSVRRVRIAAYLIAVAISGGILLSPCKAAPLRQSAETSGAAGDFSGTVDLGQGRRIYLECRGAGSPTVILESGLRTRGDNWSRADLLSHGGDAVLPEIAKFARVCTYDRPGTTLNPGEVSRSDPAPMPRTAMDVAQDLHALLHAAGVPGPYVLAGHSFGGLFVRLYRALYPQEVSGLVLVDALAEQIKALFKPTDWKIFLALNSGPLPEFENYAALETIDFNASFDQMKKAAKAAPSKNIPVVILVRGLRVELLAGAPPEFGEILESAWRKSKDNLAAALPHIQFVIASKSGHYIQLDEPTIVVQAIRAVVEQAPHR